MIQATETEYQSLADIPQKGDKTRVKSEPDPGKVPSWPRNWQRQPKADRTLAFAASGLFATEHQQVYEYRTILDLYALTFQHDSLVFLTDAEFSRIYPKALRRWPGCGVWASAPEKVIGVKLRSGRHVRYWYRASLWSLTSGFDLPRLRSWLEKLAVGTCATAGSAGSTFYAMWMPEGVRFQRPPGPAWRALYNHLLGGRTELLEAYRGSERCTEYDLESAYPSALAYGVPAGHCNYCLRESDLDSHPWTFASYRVVQSADSRARPGVVSPVGRRSGEQAARHRHDTVLWSVDPGELVWLTGDEAHAARDAGLVLVFVEGWGWEQVSTDFARGVQRLRVIKAAYQAVAEAAAADGLANPVALELQWTKLAMNAAIGRFGMDDGGFQVWAREEDIPLELRDQLTPEHRPQGFHDENAHTTVYVSRKPAIRNDQLVHIAVAVHAAVRLDVDRGIQDARLRGYRVLMRNVDALYFHGEVDIKLPSLISKWKQTTLDVEEFSGTIQIDKNGTVIAGNVRKEPGVKR